MDPLQGLTDQVAQNTSVEGSAKQLLDTLAQKLKDAGTDGTKLKALADSLSASSTALAASVAANTQPPTPQPPTPQPPQPPTPAPAGGTAPGAAQGRRQ